MSTRPRDIELTAPDVAALAQGLAIRADLNGGRLATITPPACHGTRPEDMVIPVSWMLDLDANDMAKLRHGEMVTGDTFRLVPPYPTGATP